MKESSNQYDICDILNLDTVEFTFNKQNKSYSYPSLNKDFFDDLLNELNFNSDFSISFKFKKKLLVKFPNRETMMGGNNDTS